ncbi:MAG: DUF3488 domain-containing protein [Nitrospirae bacterium]|nr:DUF3488 domain-containing protein [Nitrospirota bacterium]
MTASVALVLTGATNPLFTWPAIFIPIGYIRTYRNLPSLPRRTVGLLVFLELALFMLDAAASRDILIAVTHLTIAFQALKSFDIAGHEDHTQVHFMGLLQVVLVSEMTLSIWFAALLLVFMVNLVYSQMDGYLNESHNENPVPVTGAAARTSFWMLLLLALFFVTFPRAGHLGLWGKSHVKKINATGFTDAVEFGSYEGVKRDDTIVMRAEIDGAAPRPLYWRGTTMEVFDGTAWHRYGGAERAITPIDNRFRLRSRDYRASLVKQTIYLEPINSKVLIALARPVEIESDAGAMMSDDRQVVRLAREPRGRISYTVWSDTSLPPDESDAPIYYLQVPPSLKNIPRIAAEATGTSASDYERAMRIGMFLRNRFSYSLNPPPPPAGVNPIEDFLANTRTGYCEHFATAMTLMLRSVGIRARVVTGFMGGAASPVGRYVIVRQSDAHAWVEAYIDGGWKRFDPTPPAPFIVKPSMDLYFDTIKLAWLKYVVGFSSLDQRNALRTIETGIDIVTPEIVGGPPKLRKVIVPLSVSIAAIALIQLIRRLRVHHRKHALSPAGREYMKIRRKLARLGYGARDDETPFEHGARVAKSGGPKEAREAARLYYESRYGGMDRTSELRKMLARLSGGSG